MRFKKSIKIPLAESGVLPATILSIEITIIMLRVAHHIFEETAHGPRIGDSYGYRSRQKLKAVRRAGNASPNRLKKKIKAICRALGIDKRESKSAEKKMFVAP